MELDYSKLAKGFPKPLERIYLMLGSDDALKREALLKLTEPLLDSSFADFDREEIDIPPTVTGDAGEAGRAILASAGGVPLASERRVVIVTNVQRLGKEDQEMLAAGLPKLGELTCLVLVAGATEFDAGKVKGKTLGTKLLTAIGKAGATVQCDAPGESGLQARANALLKSRGKTIEPAGLALILDRAKATASERGGGGKTGDINVLVSELEKAMAYAGDRPLVTRADAAAVGRETVQDNIFALMDAIGHRDARRALDEADHLLEAGDKPDGVAARTFVMLARHLRQLWGAKYLADQRLNGFNIKGGLPPDVQPLLSGEMLGITQRQSYLLKNLQEQARAWTYPSLQSGLRRILASDLAMKSIVSGPTLNATAPADDPASNLRLLVVELCRAD
ncbi:MAG: DNA polymerase III subunit delta [Janthinobacterium lividum]